jgi:hypothetical protein
VNLDPKNGVHIRYADHPWGPWSAPKQLFEPGSPTATPSGSAPATQYGQNGMLFHKDCTRFGSKCAPGESFFLAGFPPFFGLPPFRSSDPFGWLYNPNIIEDWTMSRTSPVPGADIYWTVSTFDPYQVVLMRSRINKP